MDHKGTTRLTVPNMRHKLVTALTQLVKEWFIFLRTVRGLYYMDYERRLV